MDNEQDIQVSVRFAEPDNPHGSPMVIAIVLPEHASIQTAAGEIRPGVLLSLDETRALMRKLRYSIKDLESWMEFG